jgi:hypothetical protein
MHDDAYAAIQRRCYDMIRNAPKTPVQRDVSSTHCIAHTVHT